MVNLLRVENGVATREPVPAYLDQSQSPEALASLLDLTWLGPTFGLAGVGWWPEENIDPPLDRHKKFGDDIFQVDEDRKVVVSSHVILDMTEEEAQEQDAVTVALRKRQVRQARINREQRGYGYQGHLMPIDDSSRLRLAELGSIAVADPDFAGFYPSPTDPWFELDQTSAIALSQSAALFLWACLQREHEIVEAIEAWTFTEDMLSEGWPE